MSFIKLQDKTILEFDLNTGNVKIRENNLLPIPLRDALVENVLGNDPRSFLKNYRAITSFFRNRCLSIKRENAKKILNALNISQRDDDETIIKIMVMCKGLSVTDDYWLTNNKDEPWESVNLRQNPLHEVLAQIALHGNTPPTITGKLHTPELTGQGAYAKAWRREKDGLFLYKASTSSGMESEVEVECSRILDYTNVPHLQYTLAEEDGKRVSICKSMCDDEKGIVSAEDVFAWCNRKGKDFDTFVKELDAENFYKTIIVDYLIANPDRHGQNWGFYMDNHTGKLIGLHPLFDHNNAFDEQEMQDKHGGMSLMIQGKSKWDAAKFAMKRCDFQIDRCIPKDIFLTEEHFRFFAHRAYTLGIELSEYVSGNDRADTSLIVAKKQDHR